MAHRCEGRRPDPAAPTARGPDGMTMTRTRIRFVLVGAVLGLTWATSLRAFMMVIAGADSTFTFAGTFGIILPSGTLVGALLGWAEHRRRTGRSTSWLIPTPLLLVVLPFVFTGDGTTPLTLAVLGMIGGFSAAGRGPRTARILAGAVVVAGILVVFLAPQTRRPGCHHPVRRLVRHPGVLPLRRPRPRLLHPDAPNRPHDHALGSRRHPRHDRHDRRPVPHRPRRGRRPRSRPRARGP